MVEITICHFLDTHKKQDIMNLVELLIIRPFCDKSRAAALKKAQELISIHNSQDCPLLLLNRKEHVNDIAIMVFSQTTNQQEEFSLNTRGMAEYFSQFGWIDHSTWEIFGKKQATNLELFFRED